MTETARVYGDSLYDLAVEEQLIEEIYEDLLEIREVFAQNPDYLRVLEEPSIKLSERLAMLETAFGEAAQRYLVNFLKLLCERDLLGTYEECCEEYTRRYNADHGIAEAVVVSAVALSEEQLSALQTKLEQMSGKKISMKQKVDPSVIAGLRIELEGKQLDGTVQGRLAGISRKLNEIIV